MAVGWEVPARCIDKETEVPREGRAPCVTLPSECGLSRGGHAERRWAKAEPGPCTPDGLPPPSDSGGFGPRLRSLAWGLAQALPEEGVGSTAPCPLLTLQGCPPLTPCKETGLSALPSLLVLEAVAIVWSERVTSPLSYQSNWSAFLDWLIQLSKPESRTAVCWALSLSGVRRVAVYQPQAPR